MLAFISLEIVDSMVIVDILWMTDESTITRGGACIFGKLILYVSFFSSRNVDEKRAKCPVKTILGNFRRTIGIGSIEPTNF